MSVQSFVVLAQEQQRREEVVPVVQELNSATAAIAGFASGTITRVMICNSLAPSTRAASESSSGIVRKNCRSRKIENASPEEARQDQRLQVTDPVEARTQIT